MGEGDNTVTMDPAAAEAAGRARVDLDAKRKRTAEAWMAFEKRRDQLTKQEAQPTDQEASELQGLHATYQAAANAEDEAVNNWLDAIDGNGNGKTGTFIRHKRTGRAGGAVSKAVIDALDAKTLVAPQGAVIAPDVLELIVSKTRRPHSVLGLVGQARTEGDEIRFLAATTETPAAAPVSPGAVKPTSVLETQVQSAPVRTVATVSEPIDRAVTQDFALLGEWVESTLADAVALAIEDEVIVGSGTAPHLRGITNTPGIASVPYGSSPLDTIAAALKTLEVGNISASGIAINPADYWTMLAVREGGTTGPYLLGDPTAAGPTTLWGVPVVRSTAIAAGQAIIAHWSQAVLVVREGTTIAWADAHTDLFVRNQVILRVESRVAFYVARPTAFAIADLTA